MRQNRNNTTSQAVLQQNNTEASKRSKSTIELFIAPVITGVVISLLSYFGQYLLAKEQLDHTTYYNERNNAYLESINLLNEYYQTLTLSKSDSSLVEFHKYNEVNLVYDRLLMLGVNKQIPVSFMNFFAHKVKLSPAHKAMYINLLAHDLYDKSIDVPYDSVTLTIDPLKVIPKNSIIKNKMSIE